MKYHNFTFTSSLSQATTDFNINWGCVLIPNQKYNVRVTSLQMAYPVSGIDNTFHANLHIVGLGCINSYICKESDTETALPYTDIVSPLRIESIEGSTADAVYQINGTAKIMTIRNLPNNLITIRFLKGNGDEIAGRNLGSFSVNLEFEECD